MISSTVVVNCEFSCSVFVFLDALVNWEVWEKRPGA
jgi:hypothetical protein